MNAKNLKKWRDRATEVGLPGETMTEPELDAFRTRFKDTRKLVKAEQRANKRRDGELLKGLGPAVKQDSLNAARKAVATPAHSGTLAEDFGAIGFRPKV